MTHRNLADQPVLPVDDVQIGDVKRRLAEHGRSDDENLLERAYEYSTKQHTGQSRRSGEPYITHPLAVAYLLADFRFDATCAAVGLLHDVLEDTGVSKEELRTEFGDEIASLVDGVSKIGRHEYVRRDESQAETFRKLVLASAKDLRVIVVKLVDRLHNMQTLSHMSKESQRRISRETLEIYAPIAHRLGMSKVKGELEDLAFYHLYPHQFSELQTQLREKVKLGTEATERIRRDLAAALEEAGIDGEIGSRVKRHYSIYQKLRRQEIDISELYDYLAFRVVVADVRDCYAVLGVVHQKWRPIPGRFKDYIAVPKPNLYQSLHTTVVGERGQPFEVQIRTVEMDLVAEEGIAAHWTYKEGKTSAASPDRDIVWLRHLIEWQQDVSDPRSFLHALKIDLYPEEVYVFTPKGEVLSFPRGATPLDFAYRVHTELGHQCVGARVSGRLVPLRTALQNGDIVEIMTNANREPSRDWLSIATTPRAKGKIRHWLNTQQKRRSVEIGRTLFEKEVRRHRMSLRRIADSEGMADYLRAEGLASIDELYSQVGFGRSAVRSVLKRLLSDEELARAEEEPTALRRMVNRILPASTSPVLVRGQGDLLAYLAKCCSPLPGEDIVGYVTRGRGVSVHSQECPNVQNLLYHPEREIAVEWAKEAEASYDVALAIDATDAPGLLAKIAEAIAKQESNIRSAEATTSEMGKATVQVVVEVKNRRHLDRLQRALLGLPAVSRVERRMGIPGGKGSHSPEE